jgi:hypothetical protein
MGRFSLRPGFRFIACGLQRHKSILQPTLLAQGPSDARDSCTAHRTARGGPPKMAASHRARAEMSPFTGDNSLSGCEARK